jgi:two-component system, chemotaxis family, sensor kinase CheA
MDELLKDFLNESSEQLEAIDSQLVRFEREPSDARIVANIFRLVHVIKSACGFLNLQRLERVAYSAETLIILLRDGATPSADAVALMLATIDRIKFILRAVSEGRGEPPGDDDRLIAEIESAGETRREAPEPLASPAGYVCEGILGSGTTPTERRADSVRVSLDALERLTSLVSELVLTRNQLVAAAGAADSDRLRAPLRRLSTVTADLRSGLQAARMLPIARLFTNLQRLVRGLSAETGKKVELTLRGGETEVDRQLIEAIRNPLTQIIRNAVAHAIEPLEERRRMGKPDLSVIDVSARSEAGIVSIEVADDGRGLDFDAIRRRRFASGLGSRDELAALSETDLCRCLFAPGFGAVLPLGGVTRRSPGLEIVRANLEQIGGSASLTNRPGCGATVSLQIPLATAVVPAFILRVQDERFAAPRRLVEEIVKLDAGDDGVLIDVRGTLALVTAEGILPAGHLGVLIGSPMQTPVAGANPRIALRMRAGLRDFALIVDEMIDVQEIVLEPLPTPLRQIPMFSGAAVLGDGSVVLVLDPCGLASALGLPNSSAPRKTPRQHIKPLTPSTAFVVFRSGGPTLRALPVTAVAKILQLGPTQIEIADGGVHIIHDEGRRIPLVDIKGCSFADPRTRSLTALLLRQGDGSLGLIVDEIVDVIDEELKVESGDTRRTAIGDAILRRDAIEILDPVPLFDRRRIPRRLGPMAEGAGVLILEPATFFRSMIAGTLDRNGYQTHAVGDLASALTTLETGCCVVALVDVQLAIAHQEEIARRFHDALVGRPPILIGLASHGGPAVRARARKVGLSTAVGKFDRASLLAALRDAIREKEIAA